MFVFHSLNSNSKLDLAPPIHSSTLVRTVHTPRRIRSLNMADSVTQLQDQINTLCQLMFNYAGTLQRDAKAVRYARNSRSFFRF